MPTKSIDINAALSFGWQTTLKNWTFFVLLYLGIVIISVLLVALSRGDSTFGLLPSTIFSIVVAANIYHVTVMYADGKPATWNDLWTLPIERLLRYLWSQIIVTILTGIGLLLLVVPGIYLSLRLSQVKYLVIE